MITEQGVAVPEDMVTALEADPPALAAFLQMRPTRQRDYVDWVCKADVPEGRDERLTELPRHVRADTGAVAGR